MSAGSVVDRVVPVLRGAREGALAGTWLLAVDMASVGYRI